MRLSLYNKNDEIVTEQGPWGDDQPDRIFSKEDPSEIYIGSREKQYEEGDYIKLEVEKPNTYVFVKFDDTFEESLVYFKDVTEWVYKIPYTEDEKRAMKDVAFAGTGMSFSARLASDEEISKYQNLARNRHAAHEPVGIYPHAHANVETRNDPTFYARNAIDGVFQNDDHGSYPYQSWGINQQDDAAITIEFGREVKVDKIGITIRADFPHDTWWNEVTIEFSDGSEEVLNLEKVEKRQFFDIKERIVTSVRMCKMQKGEPGPFPALTQIEVFGYNL